MQPDAPTPDRKAAILESVERMAKQFMRCHNFLAENSYKLAELLREAESRGILLEEALSLAEVSYWLQHLDWQAKFLGVVLGFAQDPSRKTLRPLIELFGRDRDRMRVEAEILARQLEHRLATFAKPDDALVRKVILKNEKRVLAVYLHHTSGYGGAALARFFKVPRTTAYSWLTWFKSLPEGLREGLFAFMATQVPMMAACQVPAVMPKSAEVTAGGTASQDGAPRGTETGSALGPSGSGLPTAMSA